MARRVSSSSAPVGASTRSRGVSRGRPRSTRSCARPATPAWPRSASAVPVDANDPGAVAALADELDPDLVVVGPEEPLVAGVVDAADGGRAPRVRADRGRGDARGLEGLDEGRARRGRGADGAARARSAPATKAAAFAFLETLPGLYVVKTDGLAAGKGVIVTESLADARDAVRAYLSGDAFGDAGRTCVIEEGLTGPELSVFVLCDGHDAQSVRVGAGPQARVRRRPGSEHRRHGRVLARAVRARRRRRRSDGARRSGRRSPSCGRAAPSTAASCTAGSCSRPRGRRWSSTTSASATPSVRCSSPGSQSDLYVHCFEAAIGQHRDAGADARRRVRRASWLAAEGYPPRAARTGDVIDGLDDAAARRRASRCSTPARGPTGDQVVTNGGRVADRHGDRAPTSGPRATARTRRRRGSRGPGSTTVATSPPKRS